jgi:Uma2 family endonuclease
MPTAARQVHHTYAEYLTLEEESSTRHEYLDGEIYATAGGTPDHAALAAAVLRLIGGRLPRGCRAFNRRRSRAGNAKGRLPLWEAALERCI